MPDDGQLDPYITLLDHPRHSITGLNRRGVDAPETQKVEDERVDDLVRQGVLLLQQRLDEDIGRAAALRAVGGFLGRNVAEALERGSGMKNGDGDPSQNGRDDVRFSERAGAAADEGKQEALEECRRFVQALLEGVEKVDVELLSFVNIFTDSFEDDQFEKSLYNVGLARYEYPRCLEAGVC